MLIHTHKRVSKLFNKYRYNCALNFIGLVGVPGLGKIYYIKNFIRDIECDKYNPFEDIFKDYLEECSCRICKSIKNNYSSDILEIHFNKNIEDIRVKMESFIGSFPKEYKYKYLIIEDIDKFSYKEQNIFLKVLEEPIEYLKIFVTQSSGDGVLEPIKSRLVSFNCSFFDYEILKEIFLSTNALKEMSSLLGEYSFKSIEEVLVYHRFSFKELFDKLFTKNPDAFELNRLIKDFLKILQKDSETKYLERVKFFIEYYLMNILQFCFNNELNKNIPSFRDYLINKIIPIFSENFFVKLNYKSEYMINVENQLFIMFNSINLIKKIIKV